MSNILQDNEQNKEDDVKENEVLTTSWESSKISFDHAPISIAGMEREGNAHGATLTEGENSLNVLKFSTNHTNIEQHLVEPCLALPLSEVDLPADLIDKEELCSDASLITLPQQVNKLHVSVFNSPI